MPTPTYELISEQVLGSAAASATFSAIPQTYKDLVLEVTGSLVATESGSIAARYNNDSATNYSQTYMYGNGTSATSSRSSNVTYAYGGDIGSSTLSVNIIHIFSYSNTTTYKTAVCRGAKSDTGTNATVTLWRSTSAITGLIVANSSTNSFAAGTTFRLYGIAG